jgi:uncharacterized protein (DUF433 family)
MITTGIPDQEVAGSNPAERTEEVAGQCRFLSVLELSTLRPRSSAGRGPADPCHDRFMALSRVTVDPAQMGGVPCIRGLRVTVSMVLGQLAAGRTVEELLADYPYLEREDVTAALEYAAAIVNEREASMARPA